MGIVDFRGLGGYGVWKNSPEAGRRSPPTFEVASRAPGAALTPTINGSQARLKMNAESLLPTTIWVHPERTSCYLGPPPKYMLKLHRTQNIGVMGNTCQAELCSFTSNIRSSGGGDFVTLPLRAWWQGNVTNSLKIGHTG